MESGPTTEDNFKWPIEGVRDFPYKSCYTMMEKRYSAGILNERYKIGLSNLWSIKAPSKILTFGWRLILNKLSIRDQVKKRDILDRYCVNSSGCVFCFQVDEDNQYIFLECSVTKRLWGSAIQK